MPPINIERVFLMDDEQIDPTEVLQVILNNLVANASKEEIIKIWFFLGNMMGLEDIFPELRVILTPDNQGENQPILVIGTLIPLVVEHLTSEETLTESLAQKCLDKIKRIKGEKVYH
jgi:hypothetical protein